MEKTYYESLIKLAIQEDMPYGDKTTEAIFTERHHGKAILTAKEARVLVGAPIFSAVFKRLGDVKVEFTCKEGDFIKVGQEIAFLKGPLIPLLKGERIALNFIQHLSGIGTTTKAYVDLLKPYNTQLLDTRKTRPAYRMLEKYAVAMGGGTNHRFGLSDGIMIKDNHIKGAGGITEAVHKVRQRYGKRYPIEVEVTTLLELEEALKCHVEMALFDNMDKETMVEGLAMASGKILTECSGNIREKQLLAYGPLGFDYISSGFITYGSTALDLSLNIFE